MDKGAFKERQGPVLVTGPDELKVPPGPGIFTGNGLLGYARTVIHGESDGRKDIPWDTKGGQIGKAIEVPWGTRPGKSRSWDTRGFASLAGKKVLKRKMGKKGGQGRARNRPRRKDLVSPN